MTTLKISAPRIGEAHATLDGGALTVSFPDPDPPAPVAKPLLRIGVHATPAEYQRWYSQLPPPWFARIFIPQRKGLPVWTGAAAKAATANPAKILHWSFKDQVTDEVVRAHLDSKRPGVPEWLTFYHEGDINHKNDVDGYVAYWKRLKSVVDDHPARPDITLVNVHTLYASRFKRHEIDWRRFMLPGVADVDSWDCYRPDAVDAYEAVESTLGLPVAARREFDVRGHITEFGTHPTSWDTDGSRQARWYREGCAFLEQEGFEAVGFYCNVDGESEYRPTKPIVLEVWRELMLAYNDLSRTRPAAGLA